MLSCQLFASQQPASVEVPMELRQDVLRHNIVLLRNFKQLCPTNAVRHHESKLIHKSTMVKEVITVGSNRATDSIISQYSLRRGGDFFLAGTILFLI